LASARVSTFLSPNIFPAIFGMTAIFP